MLWAGSAWPPCSQLLGVSESSAAWDPLIEKDQGTFSQLVTACILVCCLALLLVRRQGWSTILSVGLATRSLALAVGFDEPCLPACAGI
jgi:ABC-type spermidine/putrescine transport system permease subunit I